MHEQYADVGGGITLCYESLGHPEAPPVLLVMGLGTQMVGWPDRFCAGLVERGFRVIRFDNRDCGRSTVLRGVKPPALPQLVRRGAAVGAPYTLDDMAGDAAGLLDHLGLEAAHVVGASMGGMIAQQLAANHPDRVRSLVSVMSTTGSRRAGRTSLRLYPVLLRRPPRTPEGYLAHTASVFEAIGTPGALRDDAAELRQAAELAYERGVHSAGTGRQLGAILATGDRTAAVRTIRAPTLVAHGTADKLVAPSGGRATVRAIPGAEWLPLDGMGHDLPRRFWPPLLDGIERTAARAGADPRARAAA